MQDLSHHQNAVEGQEVNNLSAAIDHVQHKQKPCVLQLQNEMLLVASKSLLISSVYFPQHKPTENTQGIVSIWRADNDISQLHQKIAEK